MYWSTRHTFRHAEHQESKCTIMFQVKSEISDKHAFPDLKSPHWCEALAQSPAFPACRDAGIRDLMLTISGNPLLRMQRDLVTCRMAWQKISVSGLAGYSILSSSCNHQQNRQQTVWTSPSHQKSSDQKPDMGKQLWLPDLQLPCHHVTKIRGTKISITQQIVILAYGLTLFEMQKEMTKTQNTILTSRSGKIQPRSRHQRWETHQSRGNEGGKGDALLRSSQGRSRGNSDGVTAGNLFDDASNPARRRLCSGHHSLPLLSLTRNGSKCEITVQPGDGVRYEVVRNWEMVGTLKIWKRARRARHNPPLYKQASWRLDCSARARSSDESQQTSIKRVFNTADVCLSRICTSHWLSAAVVIYNNLGLFKFRMTGGKISSDRIREVILTSQFALRIIWVVWPLAFLAPEIRFHADKIATDCDQSWLMEFLAIPRTLSAYIGILTGTGIYSWTSARGLKWRPNQQSQVNVRAQLYLRLSTIRRVSNGWHWSTSRWGTPSQLEDPLHAIYARQRFWWQSWHLEKFLLTWLMYSKCLKTLMISASKGHQEWTSHGTATSIMVIIGVTPFYESLGSDLSVIGHCQAGLRTAGWFPVIHADK